MMMTSLPGLSRCRHVAVTSNFTPRCIRALELIRSMDAKWLEYRPNVQDLLGRTGVGIVGIDPVDDGRHTIVFDPGTGDVLGTIDETTWKDERATTGMSAITQRQIVEP